MPGKLFQNAVVKPIFDSKTHISNTYRSEPGARECSTAANGIRFGASPTSSVDLKCLFAVDLFD